MRPGHRRPPLYRRVNTRARGVWHHHGSDYRLARGRDSAIGMRHGVQRGRDYTPLFRFLVAKVGQPWREVHAEAVSRLDSDAPIFLLVARGGEPTVGVVRVGESTYFSGLCVDDEGVLRKVDPSIDEHTLEPLCDCCTHTFNGVRFTRAYPG